MASKDYYRQWYQDHKEEHKAKQQAIQTAKKAVIWEAKSKPCMDCGVQYHPVVMQFDHVRGTKLFELSKAHCKHGLAAILEEIEKCDVVCANCHALRTYYRRIGVWPSG